MFSFWSSKELSPIELYFDKMGYFEKREIIRRAVHNDVDITSRFSAKDILVYAEAEAEQGIFNASYNALQGASYEVAIIGEPSLNPITLLPNTAEAQKGIVGNLKDTFLGWRNEAIFVLIGALIIFFGIKKAFK